MEEIIKLIEEPNFMKAINRIISLPDDSDAKALWMNLAEASSTRNQFQISAFAKRSGGA